MSRVLVTGTDRPVGSALLPRLVRHGLTPIGLVGDPSGVVAVVEHDMFAEGQAAVDVDTHSSVAPAVAGTTAVVHTADVRPGASSDIAAAVQSLANACVAHGSHLILISRVGADESSIPHRKALWNAEQVVEQTAGLAYTIQRVTHTHPATEELLRRPWLPLPPTTPIQPVAPEDIAGRIVGLVQAGPSQRVRDFGGPELMRFADVAHIYKQERGTQARKVPVPTVGVLAEARAGVHVTRSGDRGTLTFRQWLQG